MNATHYRSLSPGNQVRARAICPVDLDVTEQSFEVGSEGWVDRLVPPAVILGTSSGEGRNGVAIPNLGPALDGMRRPGVTLLCFAGPAGYTVLAVGGARRAAAV